MFTSTTKFSSNEKDTSSQSEIIKTRSSKSLRLNQSRRDPIFILRQTPGSQVWIVYFGNLIVPRCYPHFYPLSLFERLMDALTILMRQPPECYITILHRRENMQRNDHHIIFEWNMNNDTPSNKHLQHDGHDNSMKQMMDWQRRAHWFYIFVNIATITDV